MGNQQSAPDKKPSTDKPAKPKDDIVKRRQSIQKLQHNKSTTAGPTASIASATAQPVPQHTQRDAIQQLQNVPSPELSAKRPGDVARSISRESSRGEKKDIPNRPQEQPDVIDATPAGPMDVPTSIKTKHDDFDADHFNRQYTPITQLRPPRLPLPIDGAKIPESPRLPPQETGNDDVSIFEENEGPDDHMDQHHIPALRRKSSMLSATTQDEDEYGELQPYAEQPDLSKTVSRYFNWTHGGEKIYITGSFNSWAKKIRLHPSKNDPKVLEGTIHLPAGTHHLKFIVDGDMTINTDYPTAVDFANFLVNYIEISPEDVARERRMSERTTRSDIKTRDGTHPPQTLEVDEEEQDAETPGEDEPQEPQDQDIPLGDFRQIIPPALLGMELEDSDSKYQQALNVVQDWQGPPSLPLFLAKSVLNNQSPMKDDSSVLILPNHTVLNHLATSNIKNNVLATSVTTRYKAKYVTTIMYKPIPSAESMR